MSSKFFDPLDLHRKFPLHCPFFPHFCQKTDERRLMLNRKAKLIFQLGKLSSELYTARPQEKGHRLATRANFCIACMALFVNFLAGKHGILVPLLPACLVFFFLLSFRHYRFQSGMDFCLAGSVPRTNTSFELALRPIPKVTHMITHLFQYY